MMEYFKNAVPHRPHPPPSLPSPLSPIIGGAQAQKKRRDQADQGGESGRNRCKNKHIAFFPARNFRRPPPSQQPAAGKAEHFNNKIIL